MLSHCVDYPLGPYQFPKACVSSFSSSSSSQFPELCIPSFFLKGQKYNDANGSGGVLLGEEVQRCPLGGLPWPPLFSNHIWLLDCMEGLCGPSRSVPQLCWVKIWEGFIFQRVHQSTECTEGQAWPGLNHGHSSYGQISETLKKLDPTTDFSA